MWLHQMYMIMNIIFVRGTLQSRTDTSERKFKIILLSVFRASERASKTCHFHWTCPWRTYNIYIIIHWKFGRVCLQKLRVFSCCLLLVTPVNWAAFCIKRRAYFVLFVECLCMKHECQRYSDLHTHTNTQTIEQASKHVSERAKRVCKISPFYGVFDMFSITGFAFMKPRAPLPLPLVLSLVFSLFRSVLCGCCIFGIKENVSEHR